MAVSNWSIYLLHDFDIFSLDVQLDEASSFLLSPLKWLTGNHVTVFEVHKAVCVTV